MDVVKLVLVGGVAYVGYSLYKSGAFSSVLPAGTPAPAGSSPAPGNYVPPASSTPAPGNYVPPASSSPAPAPPPLTSPPSTTSALLSAAIAAAGGNPAAMTFDQFVYFYERLPGRAPLNAGSGNPAYVAMTQYLGIPAGPSAGATPVSLPLFVNALNSAGLSGLGAPSGRAAFMPLTRGAAGAIARARFQGSRNYVRRGTPMTR